jgi:CDP-6-deoxy-D-xylo-4-hexulose-3-dehydrase
MKEAREALLRQTHDYAEKALSMSNNFIAGQSYIPVSGKTIFPEDISQLVDSCLDMWFTTGRFAEEFERKIPSYLGRQARGLLVNSGSSANLMAVSALSSNSVPHPRGPILPGEEVITVAAGFPTTVNPIVQNGWVPVFVDVDLTTLNADIEVIKSAKTSKTRAVVLAHTMGNPFRADLLADWCEKEGLYLIEDCCDALGAEIGGKPVGQFGEYSTLSFYPAHHITAGEGGAVISRDGRWRRIAESFRDWGRDCWCDPGCDNTCKKRFDWQMGDLPKGYDHKYIYSHVGYNLKATDFQASLVLSQLKHLSSFIESRRRNWSELYRGIKSSPLLSEFLQPVEPTPGTSPSWFGFAINCHARINRNELVSDLERARIGTRLLFGGNLVKQPAYRNVSYRICGELKNTDSIMTSTFWMGVHPRIGDQQIQYMLETLERLVKAQLTKKSGTCELNLSSEIPLG